MNAALFCVGLIVRTIFQRYIRLQFCRHHSGIVPRNNAGRTLFFLRGLRPAYVAIGLRRIGQVSSRGNFVGDLRRRRLCFHPPGAS